MELPALAHLAARAGLPAPVSPTGAGARLLVEAAQAGRQAVPASPAEVWAAWVDLGLWAVPRTAVPGRDLTALAVADLVDVAERVADGDDDVQVPSEPGRALDREQDARLRTLSVLRQLGELAPELRALERQLRSKDQRGVVRPPAPVAWPR